MSAAENKAVFLSYASQDAAAARRICEALRAAGVEVWFDQSELRGGDAWDQKIRKQIKECALFVPIISANTQARQEGYFRLEWRLADQRTHLMGRSKAFLVPVCVDETRDSEADVPDSFLAVQWTRLPGGEASVAFAARVNTLLASDAAARPSMPASGGTAGEAPAIPRAARSGGRMRIVGALAAVLAVIGVVVWKPWQREIPANAANAAMAANVPGASEADRLVVRVMAMFAAGSVDYTRADLAAAETLAKKATELAPESADAWAARAYVQASYVWRFWDRSEKRRQDAEAFANQSLAFDRNQVHAILALAEVHTAQQSFAQAETLARRGIALRPDDSHLLRVLAGALEGQGRAEEAARLREETVRRLPRDPLSQYGLANQQIRNGDFAGALQSLEKAVAVAPFGSALLNQARILAGWKGDLPAARRVLDQLTPDARTELRAVGVAMWLGLLERRLEPVQAAAALTAQSYLVDGAVVANGPKAMSVALALHVAGKEALALQQWQAAEAAARRYRNEFPGELRASAYVAIALAWQGRVDEAKREIATYEATVREQPGGARPALLLARFYASLGDGDKAATHFHGAESNIERCAQALQLDPWWDKIRGQPAFESVLAEAKQRTTSAGARPAPALDQKSVAVLAFENRSSEKDSEYFSEGISDELINVLGRVPGLRVVARTSSFSFKGRTVTTQEIARALGVTHVVEGSVQRDGGSARVIARLIRADTGEPLWSDSFTREVKNILALQEDIAGLIANALSLKLGAVSPAAKAAVHPEALRLYLEGRQAWNLRTAEGFVRAEAAYRRALELEPNFARAVSGLADVGAMRLSTPSQRQTRREEVVTQADRAIALDPTLAEPHATLGLLACMDWDFAAADRHFQRAIALNPSYAWTRLWRGQSLITQGRMDEAMTENQRALEADPLAPRIASNTALFLLLAGRPADALASADRALSLLPGEPQALTWKAEALLMLGRADEALRLVRGTLATHPQMSDFTYVLAQAGTPAEKAAALAAPDQRFAHRTRSLLATGRVDEALAGFDADARISVFSFQFVLFHPAFDGVRQDPRFVKMLETAGLTEAHARAQAWRAANPPQKPEGKK